MARSLQKVVHLHDVISLLLADVKVFYLDRRQVVDVQLRLCCVIDSPSVRRHIVGPVIVSGKGLHQVSAQDWLGMCMGVGLPHARSR